MTVGAAATSERSAFGAGFPELLDAARAGAPWALEAIYVELHPRVLAFMAGRAPREAEDLASEVFVSVAEGLSRFEGDERQLRAWVFTIAYRRLSDLWRRSHRRRTEPSAMEHLDDLVPAGDAEAEAVDNLSSAEALRIIAALPSPQAEVVLLRVIAGLPVEEVAAVLGKRPGTVRVIQHRALIRLARTRAGGQV
jgi:RNA polymerase sigma-70 factor (ECF subfamily)